MSTPSQNQIYRPLIVNINITNPIEIKQSIALKNLTILMGPNEVGKTTILERIIRYAEAVGSTAIQAGYDLVESDVDDERIRAEVSIDESIDYVIYANPSAVFADVYKSVKKLKYAVTLRTLADAISEVNRVLDEIHTELKDNYHEEEFEPIASTLKLIDDPNKPTHYPSFVVTLALYSYALSKDSKVLLLIDEPEAFAYPSIAYTVGRILRHLTGKSRNLFTVTATHSWDFYAGAVRGGAEWIEAYDFKRVDKKVFIEKLKEGLYMPGFSVSGLLR